MLRVGVVDEVHASATFRDVLLVIWRQAPTLAALDDVHEAARQLTEAAPDGIGVLGVAQAGMPMIGAVERRRAGDLLKEFGAHIRALASVIEGSGFLAGTTRSVMTAITLMARPPSPVKIFATVAEAVAWQAPLVGARAAELAAATEELRRKMR
jgi:hypothetical protein